MINFGTFRTHFPPGREPYYIYIIAYDVLNVNTLEEKPFII